MMRRLVRGLPCCVFVLLACGGEAEEPTSPIVGDWFDCGDDACELLVGDYGQRYTADGRVFMLMLPRKPLGSVTLNGDPYCVVAQTGTYRYDHATGELTMMNGSDPTPWTSKPTIEDGRWGGDVMVRVRENATGVYSFVDGMGVCDVSGTSPLD